MNCTVMESLEVIRLTKKLVESVRTMEPGPIRFNALLCCQKILHMHDDHDLCTPSICDKLMVRQAFEKCEKCGTLHPPDFDHRCE